VEFIVLLMDDDMLTVDLRLRFRAWSKSEFPPSLTSSKAARLKLASCNCAIGVTRSIMAF
jgi:hypothetical protein